MAFSGFSEQTQAITILQRALERGRLGHCYLFSGSEIQNLEGIAGTLAKVLNCQEPVTGSGGVAIDCCDRCLNCRKIMSGNHPDVHWIRPESKSRVITMDQVRDLMREVHLKPGEASFKVAIISGADRLNPQAANAFLKTLEEPPRGSVLILLTTEPQRILETILSRCLRLNFAGESVQLRPDEREWLTAFSSLAAAPAKSLLSRYRLMDQVAAELTRMKSGIEETLTAQSPLRQNPDAEKDWKERWEGELAALVEAEYRRQRTDLLLILQRWLRDIWILTLRGKSSLAAAILNYPEMKGAESVAARIGPGQARDNLIVMERLQRLLSTNVQEALALEVCMLKLHL